MSELARIETLLVLRSVDLFSACSAEQIFRISAIVHQQRFRAGETIYRTADPAVALYCVARGRVRLGDPEGGGRTIGALGMLGVAEILSGRLHAHDATAESETLVLVIDAEDFFDLLANNVEIVKALFRRLLETR